MGSLIKKYAKGTPKPFAVAVKKKAATEQEASTMIVASGDRKATASPTKGGKYVVRYRKWFDTSEAAQAFVDTASAKSKPQQVQQPQQVVADEDFASYVRKDLQSLAKGSESHVRLVPHGYKEIVEWLTYQKDRFIPILLETIEKAQKQEAAKGGQKPTEASVATPAPAATPAPVVEPSVSPEKVAEIKSGLEKLATFCTQRELTDLAAKTKSVLDLI